MFIIVILFVRKITSTLISGMQHHIKELNVSSTPPTPPHLPHYNPITHVNLSPPILDDSKQLFDLDLLLYSQRRGLHY